MMSNIADVFNPPVPRDLTPDEAKDCIPCQFIQTFTSMGVGAYFLMSPPKGSNPKVTTGPLWTNSLRVVGAALILNGIRRGGQGWLWDKDREYKDWKLSA